MPNIDALLRGIRDRLAQENAVANQRGYPGYTPPTNPNQVLQAQSATAMQAALANQDAFVNRRRGAIPAPGIDYSGGGSGVTANDIMGQYGPVVTQPRPQPVPQPTLPPGAQAAESQYYGNMYQEAERQNALNAMIPGQFAAMQAQVQQGQAALPVRGTVPQMQDILKFEANTQLPSGNGWTPPVTQDPNGPSIADLAAYRNEQGQIAWETSWRDLQSAQEALQMADVAFRANPSDDNRLALNRAENNVKLASNKWQVVQENYQPDRVDPISGVAMPALNALDIPRQKVVEEMGANAYDVATGDSSSWSPGLAGVAMANWNFPGLGRLTQDFETWANDPKNWQIIRNASENGFQASPEMPKFTGGRAVWELFINTAGGFYKAAMDTFLDPTIMFGAMKGAGTGVRLAGEGAAAGRDATFLEKTIGNTLRAAGTALEVPQIISDKTVDAIIPGAIKSAKVIIGGGLELLPGESGSRIVGKAEKAVAKSAQELARAAGDETISAASNTIYAAQEMRGLPSLPVDPNVVPGDPTQMDLINAANPAGYVTRPDGRSIPLFPGTTEEQLATPSVVPDVRKDSYQPPMTSAEQPVADAAPVVDRPAAVAPSVVPDPATTPVERDWTRTPEVEQTFSDLRSRYPAEQVDRYVAQWEANSQAYRAADAGTTGTTRMPTAHAEYMIRQYQTFRDLFPDEAMPVYKFRYEFGDKSRAALIEYAVFGTDAQASQARKWMREAKMFDLATKSSALHTQAKGLQLSFDATPPATAAPEPVNAPATGSLPGYGTTSVDNLTVDTATYQNRKAPYSEQSVNNIIANYNPAKFDPIEVRQNADGTFTVLSGHSRYEAVKRMVASGQIDGSAVPIKIQTGSEQDLKILAQTSNTRGTGNTPTEKGRLLTMLQSEGMSRDAAMREVNVKGGEAKRLEALTNLPEELATYVDNGQLSVPQGAMLGDAISSGLMTKQEAASFYLNRMMAKGYSDTGLADTLRVMAEMKKAASPQATMTSMFGDADLGGSGASAAMDRIDELAALRRKLKGQAAAISSTMKVDLPEIKAANDSLAKGKATLEARVRDLEVELGIGKRPPGKRTGQAVGIVPQEPYFVRLSKFQKAQSAAEKSQAEAMTARIAGKDTGAPRTGPIVSDKTADTLNQTFQSNPKYIGQTHRQVLEGMLGKRLEDSTLEELHAVGAGFRDAISVEMNVPDPNLWERTMVRAARGFSAFTLLPLWNAPKMLLINTGIGNSTQAMIGGQAAAIRKMWDWDHVKALEKAAFKNEIPRSSPMWEAAEGWGLGGFNPKHSGHSVIDAVAEKRVESKIKSAAGKATPGLRSKFKPGAAVAKVTGQNITRNANNGLEWSARTGLWAHNLDLAARGWKRVFTGEAVVRTRKMAPDITDQEVQAVLAQMPARFSGTDVYRDFKRLAKSKGMSESAAESYADRLGRDWANKISVAEAEASRVVDKVFFDLSERNIDRFLKGVIPFHMWYTRALPFYAEAGMRHPGFAAAYYRMLEATDKQAEQEGWPSSLRGFIKLGTGPGGIAMFFNPVAALSLLDAFIVRDGGYTPENMSAIGKVLDRAADYGFGILPWWSAMLNYSGYLGDSSIGLDPIGTYGARKLFGGLVQIAATNGLFGEDWEKYLGKPFESALQDLRQLTSGKTPGSVNVPAGDPAAYGQQMINNIALTVYLRQKGITEEQYRAMGTQPYGSPGYKQWQEINDSVTADLDSQGPIYDEALDQYTASLGWNIFLDRIIQGGQKLRQIDQIERGNASATGVLGDVPGASAKPFRLALTDPYSDGVVTQNEINWMREYKQTFGVTYKEGDLARMRAAIRAEKDMATVTPEARPLVVASMEYNMLGSEQDRIYVNYYNDIAFGDIPASKPIFVDGVTYTRTDLQGMTTDQRFNLADRWLEIHDTTGTARKLQDERAVYKDAHPEYKLYADWRKDVSKAWGDLGPRGLALYRSELVKENPNARRYFEDQQRTIIDRLRRRLRRDPSAAEVQAELDKATTSLAAYQAVKGIQTRITDPKPDDAGVDPRPPGYSSGGTGSGASDKVPYDQKVRDAQDNMKAWLTKVNAALSQVYGQPVDYSMLPGPVKAAADAQLERLGITAPDDANLYWAYVKWRADQMRIGGNSSVEAFIAATSEDPK